MPPVETLSLFSTVLLGFSLGIRHATDADHVVAVATIVSRERSLRGAAFLGSIWGVGHTLTIVLVGGAIVVFGVVIPPRAGQWMELAVAPMLILLGGLSIAAALRRVQAAATAHEHGEGGGGGAEAGHSHPHPHHEGGALARLDRRLGHVGLYKLVRPLVVGVVHGLAGSAALALVVLGTLRDPAWAMAYLLVFGVGTIAGMMSITTALAVPFAYSAGRFARVNRWLGLASGLLSFAFGLLLVYRIGFVEGLFSTPSR